jgi:hypothetical protein
MTTEPTLSLTDRRALREALVAEIDEFTGAWRALGTLAPERLSALRRVATIESIAALWSKRTLLYFSDLCAALRFPPSLAARLLPEILQIPVAGRLGARPVAE